MYQGYALAIFAYIIWGLLPLYFKMIGRVPIIEVVIHRTFWVATSGAALMICFRYFNWWRDLRENPARFLNLTFSGLLIFTNSAMYAWSVNSNRILDTSLGYYLSPIVSVFLGLVFCGERLRRMQWVAVFLAVVGVVLQVWHAKALPWVSLVLAFTFSFYGLVRKKTLVDPLPGLVVETTLLIPAALAWLFFLPSAITIKPIFWDTVDACWLIAAGPITLLPLICYNVAARRLPYTSLGFLQYLSPTLVFLQAVLLFGEELRLSKFISFVCIWAGLGVYSVDSWLASRRPA